MVLNIFAARHKEGLLWKDLIFLTILLGGLFLVFLGHRPLGVPGEGRYVEIPREMLASGDFLTPHLNGLPYFEKPPLFYWIEAAAIHLFGLSDNFFLRLPIALFALLGCLGVFLFGRLCMGRRAGLWASFVLGTNLLYFGLSRVLLLDLVFTVFMTGALLTFFAVAQKSVGWERRGLTVLYGLFIAAGVMTKGLIGTVLPGTVLLLWIVGTRQWALLKLAFHPLALFAFCGTALPWHIAVCFQNPAFFNFYFVHEHFLRYLTPIHHHDEPLWVFIPIVFLGFFPWIAFLPGTIQAFRQKALILPHNLTSFCVIWAAFVFIFFSFSSSKLIPYILPVFPPLALLVGAFLASDSPALQGALKIYGVMAFAAGVALLIYFPLRNFVWDKGYNLPFIMPQVIVTVLILWAGILGVLFYLHKNPRKALVSLTSFLLLFLVSLAYIDPLFQRVPSIKPMMEKLKPYIAPQDHVISYDFFPHDVPVYLERPIQVLFHKGELAFGASITPHQDILLAREQFEEIWNGPHRAFLLMPPSHHKTPINTYWKTYFPSLKLYFVDNLGLYNLFTNKP